MKVLIIPEDPTLDRHILKPIVQRMFADLGRPANVDMLEDPHLSGVDEALDPATIGRIVAKYPMIDLFLLMVDRDGDRTNNSLKAAARESEHPEVLLACLAREEVEVWMLALYRDEVRQLLGARWQEIRGSHDPKESYARPFLAHKNWTDGPGSGRKEAMRSLPTQWNGLLSVCEELSELKQRLQHWLQAR